MKDRLLDVWANVTLFLILPLLMLAVVLRWPPAVQVPLTVVAGVAIFGPRIAVVSGWGKRGQHRLPR